MRISLAQRSAVLALASLCLILAVPVRATDEQRQTRERSDDQFNPQGLIDLFGRLQQRPRSRPGFRPHVIEGYSEPGEWIDEDLVEAVEDAEGVLDDKTQRDLDEGEVAGATRPDGSTVTVTQNPDGSRTVTTTDASGNVTSTETRGPGPAPASASITHPDGSTVMVTQNPDGSRTVSTSAPDGTVTSTRTLGR